MTSRHRVREIRHQTGNRYRKIQTTVFNDEADDSVIQQDACDDVIGLPHVDHSLLIEKFDGRFVLPLNGEVLTALPSIQRYRDYQSVIPYSNRTHLVTAFPSVGARATTLQARTNPSRINVAPLSLIQDIVDLPKMLKHVKYLLTTPRKLIPTRELANHSLAVQFGWLPLIGDLNKMFNFQKAVDQRSKELQRLYSKGGLKRRMSLGSAHTEGQGLITMESGIGLTIYSKYSKFTSVDSWGTIRWLPTGLPPWTSQDGKYIDEARHLVSGFTINGLNAGAWDLLPWSWITDWFSNTGEFMQANLNSIPVRNTPMNIMTRTTTLTNYTRLGTGGDNTQITGGSGLASFVTKKRDIVPAGDLTATLPHIGARELSIIASLYVQRFK
jgi:hypothetical protein